VTLVSGCRVLDDTDVTGTQGERGYERYGIYLEKSTLVVVRPDGYVGTVLLATAIADLDNYSYSLT
jgi:phenol 2-monooxygenase (NADPH)